MMRTPPRVSRKESEGQEEKTPKNTVENVSQKSGKTLRSPVLGELASTETIIPTNVGTTVVEKQQVAGRKLLSTRSRTPSGSTPDLRRELSAKMSSEATTKEVIGDAAHMQVIGDSKPVGDAIRHFDEELLAIKYIIRDMEAAIKKQPNVSRAIKDSLLKLEERVDKLQHLAKTWPNSGHSSSPVPAADLPTEAGKRSAASPPVLEGRQTTKKVRSEVASPIAKSQGETSLKESQTPGEGWTTVARKTENRPGKKTSSQISITPVVEEDNKKKKKKQRKRSRVKKNDKHDAILLKPTEGKSYSDVLAAVRTKVNPENCGVHFC